MLLMYFQAEVMLQYDGNTANKCTCFMFLKPTMMCRILLRLWEQTIVEGHKVINQVSGLPNYLAFFIYPLCIIFHLLPWKFVDASIYGRKWGQVAVSMVR